VGLAIAEKQARGPVKIGVIGLGVGTLTAYGRAGDTVRVHAVGPGFTIQGEGVAITPGIEGQSARIRTESGRTITGKPVGQRLAEVQL
jgi:hypothetical protein